MKEATGELNMTVIAVVAIAAVGAFFYAVIWPRVKNNLENNTKCADAVCSSSCKEKTCACTYVNDKGKAENITCKNKNYTGK